MLPQSWGHDFASRSPQASREAAGDCQAAPEGMEEL